MEHEGDGVTNLIGVLGTLPKNLENWVENLEIIGGAETIQTIALLRSARILRRVLETWRDLLSFVRNHQLALVW